MSTYHEKCLPKSAHKAPEIDCFALFQFDIAKAKKYADFQTKICNFQLDIIRPVHFAFHPLS